jgi:predicted secreted Zn-dependent protease
MMRKWVLFVISIWLGSTGAFAAVTQSTSYQPFVVRGKTARAIYKSVLSHSRTKDGFRTFATTDVSLRPHIKLITKPSCKVTEADITARFVVHLPSLANAAGLSPDLRRDWQSFAAELKHHEEHHREIWLGCAADLVTAATGLTAGDCKSFAKTFEERINQASKTCREKNDAFDNEAQIRLPSIAFIQRAQLNR